MDYLGRIYDRHSSKEGASPDVPGFAIFVSIVALVCFPWGKYCPRLVVMYDWSEVCTAYYTLRAAQDLYRVLVMLRTGLCESG